VGWGQVQRFQRGVPQFAAGIDKFASRRRFASLLFKVGSQDPPLPLSGGIQM